MKLKFKFKNELKYKIGIGCKFLTDTNIEIIIIDYASPINLRDHGKEFIKVLCEERFMEERIMRGTSDTFWTVSYLYHQFLTGKFIYLRGADNDYEIPTKTSFQI